MVKELVEMVRGRGEAGVRWCNRGEVRQGRGERRHKRRKQARKREKRKKLIKNDNMLLQFALIYESSL